VSSKRKSFTASLAYGSRDRRTASEAEKLFRLPPNYLV